MNKYSTCRTGFRGSTMTAAIEAKKSAEKSAETGTATTIAEENAANANVHF